MSDEGKGRKGSIRMNATGSPMPPVIMLGMHRSGTSLLSRTLSELGLFVGRDLQRDHESVFFIRCNDWILRQAQGTWDYPEIVRERAEDPAWRQRVASQVRHRLAGIRSGRYAGQGHAGEFLAHLALSIPWGWKDPRNTFTLPVWRELYPDARVIHIARHGVDVASSLVARERRFRRRCVSLVRASTIVWPRSERRSLANPWRCVSLEGAFSLWEAYMRESRRQLAVIGQHGCEIVYEEFLQEPVPVLERLCAFIGLPAGMDDLRRAARAIRPGRAFAYRQDSGLLGYARKAGTRLATFGYMAD